MFTHFFTLLLKTLTIVTALFTAVEGQNTAASCDEMLSTVTLFSNHSSINNVSTGTPLLLRYQDGNLNATNLDQSCTFPQCMFPAQPMDPFIRTDVYNTNLTVVSDHGTIIPIGPKVSIYPNNTRLLEFPDGSNATRQCQPSPKGTNSQCYCGGKHPGDKSWGKSWKAKSSVKWTLFADGTQRLEQSNGRNPIVVTVYPNATKITLFRNGTVKRVQIPVPAGQVIALFSQILYINGTQIFNIQGEPQITICPNGVIQCSDFDCKSNMKKNNEIIC